MHIITNKFKDGLLDKVGVSASVACMIHCLLLPTLLPLLSLSGLTFVVESKFETSLVAFTIVIASYSIMFSYFKRHQKLMPFYFFLSGIAFLVAAKTFVSEPMERFILPLGAALFAAAHLVNWRLCKSCVVCSDTEIKK